MTEGKRINKGGGYGLEVPREYHFQGDDFLHNWLKQKFMKEELDPKCWQDFWP